MSFAFLKDRFWIAGLTTSAVGMVLFKLVMHLFNQPVYRIVVFLLGVTLALAGLIIISFGVSRKYKNTAS